MSRYLPSLAVSGTGLPHDPVRYGYYQFEIPIMGGTGQGLGVTLANSPPAFFSFGYNEFGAADEFIPIPGMVGPLGVNFWYSFGLGVHDWDGNPFNPEPTLGGINFAKVVAPSDFINIMDTSPEGRDDPWVSPWEHHPAQLLRRYGGARSEP